MTRSCIVCQTEKAIAEGPGAAFVPEKADVVPMRDSQGKPYLHVRLVTCTKHASIPAVVIREGL